ICYLDLQQILNQQGPRDLCPQYLEGTAVFRLQVSAELLLSGKLCPELVFGLGQPCRCDGHLPALRFLVGQILELNHPQRALADVCFHGARESPVVLPGIGKNSVHLAKQVAFRQDRPIHPRHRFSQLKHSVASGSRLSRVRRVRGLVLRLQWQRRCQQESDDCQVAVHNSSPFLLNSCEAGCLPPAPEQALRTASPRGRKVSSPRKEGFRLWARSDRALRWIRRRGRCGRTEPRCCWSGYFPERTSRGQRSGFP